MKSLAALLVGLADSLPARILGVLGIGWISYAAIGVAVTSLVSNFEGHWNNIPADVLNILALGGFPEAIGMIIGALIARSALSGVSKLGKLT